MTLLGLWLVPVVISLYFHFWRFVGVWVLFSGVTGYVLYTCISKRIDRATPRRVSTHGCHLLSPSSTSILAVPAASLLLPVQVYSYFLGIYKVSVGVGIAGYALLVLEFCGIGTFLRPALAPTACLMLLWYGLYFGVLGRDCAEVAADRMVSLICLQEVSPHLLVLATPGVHGCTLNQ